MKLEHTVQPLSIDVHEAVQEFMLHQRSSGHSHHTITHYETSLKHMAKSMSEQGVELFTDIRPKHIRALLIGLQATLKPRSIHGVASDVRALFHFHARENDVPNPMDKVEMPRVPKEILPAFTRDEVQKLLKQTEGKHPFRLRDRAMLLTLLDSGIRLTELQRMKIGDVDMQTGVFKVLGKGSKERLTRLGPATLKALLKYMQVRKGEAGEPLWIGKYGPMQPAGIAETLEKLGNKAGVHTHAHKFRRTTALTMLRSGADIFSVQYLLGHSDLTVLKRYLAQTQTDYLNTHQRFSAVQALV